MSLSSAYKGMMNRWMTESPSDSFSKYVMLSAALHVSIFLIFTIKLFLFPGEPLVFQSALRVDLVALPDKITSTAAAPAPAAPAPSKPITAPKVETKPVDEKTVVLDPKKPKDNKKPDPKASAKPDQNKQQQAINRLKQMSAIEKLEEEFRQDEANKARTYKGNAISKGSDLTGISRLEHDSYVSDVERHIRQYWAIPEWLASKKLKAQVRVRFDSHGNVIRKQLIKSSGNPAFDEAAMDAVDKASPAPAPPERFAGLLENEGILFGFPE